MVLVFPARSGLVECADSPGWDIESFPPQRLRALGGWDPYNVTEDCDLGVRLFRERYQIKVLESTTIEEANSDFVNWVKQRSRWYKGYLQTFLIHLRLPCQLRREIGLRASLTCGLRGRNANSGRLQSVFWGLTLVVRRASPFRGGDIPGSRVLRRLGPVGIREFPAVVPDSAHGVPHRPVGLVLAAVLVPIYWMMMSVAAIKAIWQLVVTPSFWEKTAHGLDSHSHSDADSQAEKPEPLLSLSFVRGRRPRRPGWIRVPCRPQGGVHCSKRESRKLDARLKVAAASHRYVGYANLISDGRTGAINR